MISKAIWFSCVIYIIGNGLLSGGVLQFLRGYLTKELLFWDDGNMLSLSQIAIGHSDHAELLGGDKAVMLLGHLVRLLASFEVALGLGLLFLRDNKLSFGLMILKFFPQMIVTSYSNSLYESHALIAAGITIDKDYSLFLRSTSSISFWLTVVSTCGFLIAPKQAAFFPRTRGRESKLVRLFIALLTLMEIVVWIVSALSPLRFFESVSSGMPLSSLSVSGVALLTTVAAWCGCAMLAAGLTILTLESLTQKLLLSVVLQVGISASILVTRYAALKLYDTSTVDYTSTCLLFHVPCALFLLALWLLYGQSAIDQNKID